MKYNVACQIHAYCTCAIFTERITKVSVEVHWQRWNLLETHAFVPLRMHVNGLLLCSFITLNHMFNALHFGTGSRCRATTAKGLLKD